MQGTLSNVAAGVMLLIFRPFKVGDVIESGGLIATVTDHSLFTTELKRADGVYVFAPNTEFWGNSLINYNHNPTCRMQIVLGIDYGDDINLAIATAQKVVDLEPLALKYPAPQIFVAEMPESSINIFARVWANTPDYWTVFFNLNKALRETCYEAGTTMPFPHRTIHIEGGEQASE
ncbi:MAG: mechanosensitive ion channel family protein [Alphaproteobacteria bacterium]